MQIEFDGMKRDKTLLEQGLDFAHADLVVMVWTPHGEVRRIISMRKANEREKTFYAQHLD